MFFHIWTIFFLSQSTTLRLVFAAPENYLIKNMDTQAVQESTVCVTTSRYKSKIDNPSLLIKTALPILDAEGYAVCPDCDSHVRSVNQ